MAVTIQVFSDYVCPFCRLGEVAAKQAAAQTGAQLVWRAYQLRKEGPPRLDPQGEVMTKGWRATIYPMADRLGLALRQPTRLPPGWQRARGIQSQQEEELIRWKSTRIFGERVDAVR